MHYVSAEEARKVLETIAGPVGFIALMGPVVAPPDEAQEREIENDALYARRHIQWGEPQAEGSLWYIANVNELRYAFGQEHVVTAFAICSSPTGGTVRRAYDLTEPVRCGPAEDMMFRVDTLRVFTC